MRKFSRLGYPVLFLLLLLSCSGSRQATGDRDKKTPFLWQNANIYFLLTDRFNNGDTANDLNFERKAKTGELRGFMGGDIRGITAKIKEGYFDRLGINAIWCSPLIEQGHGAVDEGTGVTFGFHGYWTKDWTRLDPNFGTEEDLAEMVKEAHQRGIRVVLDVVINHTGPVTGADPAWPEDWVRTIPQCTYKTKATTISCTLVKNLPDIRTESNDNVALPPVLAAKWKAEGRYDKEVAELDAFFARTGYPRAPRFYIIKWLTDMVRRYGVDGFRCDTAKHIEETVWAELYKEAAVAFGDWKKTHPQEVLDNNEFYMVGEVYGYNISSGRNYDFGDQQVDFFNQGFTSLINFEMKGDAQKSYENIFSKYSGLLQNQLKGKSVLNYLSSHDDGGPFDPKRLHPMEAANKLLLCPGASQVYYGDETSRSLIIPGTQGDATLRSFMNWEEVTANTERGGYKTQDVLTHWQKLGRFRRDHPAVGAGIHTMLSSKPYIFKRTLNTGGISDAVVVGLDLAKGAKMVEVEGIFPDGTNVQDFYSGAQLKVTGGKVVVDSEYTVILLGMN